MQKAQAAVVLIAICLATASLQTLSVGALRPTGKQPVRARGLLSYLTSDRDQAGPAPRHISLGLDQQQQEAPLSLPVGQRHLPPAPHSPFWGAAGERWRPDGPLPDFSYAGYRGGLERIPWRPATHSVREFRGSGRSSGDALLAAVAWANSQALDAGWIVMYVPAGTYVLPRPLVLVRPHTVLRGAGRGRGGTELVLPAGPAAGPTPAAWLGVRGGWEEDLLARVVSPAKRGSSKLAVDDAAGLAAGQEVTLALAAHGGALEQELLNQGRGNDSSADGKQPVSRHDEQPLLFTSRVAAVAAQVVTLERSLPLDVRPALSPVLLRRSSRAFDIGIERLAVRVLRQQPGGAEGQAGSEAAAGGASGGSRADGSVALGLTNAADCWVSDVAVADAAVAVAVHAGERLTLRKLLVHDAAPPAARNCSTGGGCGGGEWGVRVGGGSSDILVRDFAVRSRPLNPLGVADSALLCAFERGSLAAGRPSLPGPRAAQLLFTDVHLAEPGGGLLASTGHATGGCGAACTSARTVLWNVRGGSGAFSPPAGSGGCAAAPELSLVGVDFEQPPANATSGGDGSLCPGWYHQPGRVSPANLLWAQRMRRHAFLSAGAYAALPASSVQATARP